MKLFVVLISFLVANNVQGQTNFFMPKKQQQLNNILKQKEKKQPPFFNKLAPQNDANTTMPIQDTATLVNSTNAGNIFALPGYNMPCFKPSSKQIYTTSIPTLQFVLQNYKPAATPTTVYNMPNAIPQKEYIFPEPNK
jgi:hypothetical protein